MNFNKLNILLGWATGILATVVYTLTLEPTMPFWDCGEFISSVHKLEVGHPPGAPLFMLIGRVFSAFVDPPMVPVMINFLSALCSGLTIVFLFWSITHMALKFFSTDRNSLTSGQTWAVLGSGLIGAVGYTFSDTFWFSAVEAEVYAMSSLFTAIVFWAILKWESVVDEGGELRWIVLIAYLMGLSIGVHLLNLLAIPAISLVYYFKRYEFSWEGLLKTGLVSLLLLFLINSGIIIYFVKFAGLFELFFVNTMGMPFNFGAIVYLLLVAAFIAVGLMITHRFKMVMLNTLILGITMAILGYTTFATVIIRSNANPPMDENNPENLFALLSYLNREQYGDRPLVFGQYFNTPLDMGDPYKDGSDVWVKSYSVREVNKKETLVLSARERFLAEEYISAHPGENLTLKEEYIESGEKKGSVPNYRKEFSGYFPRMHSNQGNHVPDYKSWSNYQDWNEPRGKEKVQNTEATIKENEQALSYYSQAGRMPQGYEDQNPKGLMKSIDRMREKMIPSVAEEFRYFTSFQIGHMYWRYLMWNVTGRQNDRQGHGEYTEGNWISGISAVDEPRVGSRSNLPEIERNNKGCNTYYFIPLVLALIGLIYQLVRRPKDFTVVMLLFILTGIAIVIYLNQTPQQPRERDYAFAGSFYAFFIWVGLSVVALYRMASELTTQQVTRIAVIAGCASGAVYAANIIAGDGSTTGLSMLIITAIGLAMIGAMYLVKTQPDVAKAAVAIILCLPSTYLLADQNWDDHSRAGRKTGLAMAINYLQSLQPNAILFTNGDNDTFPLWYAQEVEGIRTDVRIMNLSLLNTDWYIDQMKRKAYLSEPVPVKMPESKYRQGTRDVLFVDPKNETKGFMPLSEAMAVALDDTKRIDNGKNKIPYIPSYKLSVSVDNADAEKFRQYLNEGDSLVNRIEWSLGENKNYITKANFAVLDLLNNMDWDRPVYFAVTTGGDAYMGLERYFQLEGLAYRLTPILHAKNPNPNIDGGVAADIMFENMMSKFEWGNMDKEPIYMDENNRRMTTNLRLQFGHLAEQLIAENKMDSARQVLHKCLDVMPESNVPYEQPQIMWTLIELLYDAKDNETAWNLSKRMVELNNQSIDYYNSLSEKFQEPLTKETTMRVTISDRITSLAKKNLPENPEVGPLAEVVAGQVVAFGITSYEEYLKREEEMKRKRRSQDSLLKAMQAKGIDPTVKK